MPTATEARALGARGPGGWACTRAHKGARCGRNRRPSRRGSRPTSWGGVWDARDATRAAVGAA
eukprot:2696771-Prymnesium_polylepis.1